MKNKFWKRALIYASLTNDQITRRSFAKNCNLTKKIKAPNFLRYLNSYWPQWKWMDFPCVKKIRIWIQIHCLIVASSVLTEYLYSYSTKCLRTSYVSVLLNKSRQFKFIFLIFTSRLENLEVRSSGIFWGAVRRFGEAVSPSSKKPERHPWSIVF